MKLMPDSRGGALWRFALAGVLVIGFTAATTAVAGLLQFKQIRDYFNQTPALKHANVTVPDPGNAQTLMLIGSDHRAGTPWNSANTDTMMLVRIDPNSSTINVLSVPRDLKVEIPQGGFLGTAKLNEAYSIGGPNLLVKTLKDQVFHGLQVNHILDVNFGGFKALVDAIGCVYTDVDHRYYNNTLYTNYSSIDIQPGYQPLCDENALAFVRFRHTDSDLVRNARQQDFLRWAKAGYSQSQLISNRDILLRLFGAHVQTDPDLHTIDGLINLFNLIAFSAGHAIKQIPFPAQLLPCGGGGGPGAGPVVACYVTADPGAEQDAFHAFMTPTVAHASGGGPGTGAGAAGALGGSGAGGGPGAAGAGGGGGGAGGRAAPPDVTADLPDGKSQAAAMQNVGMPVFIPRVIASNSRYCTNGSCIIGPVADSYPRSYTIPDRHGVQRAAYRLTLAVNPVLGQYYGIQGVAWINPPILGSPTQTRTVNGKRLLLYFNGHKLSLVAWRTAHGAYWVSNTLTDDLTNQQMVAIAAGLVPAG